MYNTGTQMYSHVLTFSDLAGVWTRIIYLYTCINDKVQKYRQNMYDIYIIIINNV